MHTCHRHLLQRGERGAPSDLSVSICRESMPKRAAATDAPAPLGKRRSKPPQRYHEQAAAQIPEDDASDSDEPEGLARFTPAALDEPSKAVRQSLQNKQDGRERRTVCCCASPVFLPSICERLCSSHGACPTPHRTLA